VCLNAGATLYVAGVAKDIASGLAMAKAAITSGAARKKLDAFVAATQSP
jgi:anthranilate phosphoribosyltransferase